MSGAQRRDVNARGALAPLRPLHQAWTLITIVRWHSVLVPDHRISPPRRAHQVISDSEAMFLDGLTVGGITQVFDFCGEYGVLGLNLFALGQQRLVDGVDWFVAACCQPLIWRTQLFSSRIA